MRTHNSLLVLMSVLSIGAGVSHADQKGDGAAKTAPRKQKALSERSFEVLKRYRKINDVTWKRLGREKDAVERDLDFLEKHSSIDRQLKELGKETGIGAATARVQKKLDAVSTERGRLLRMDGTVREELEQRVEKQVQPLLVQREKLYAESSAAGERAFALSNTVGQLNYKSVDIATLDKQAQRLGIKPIQPLVEASKKQLANATQKYDKLSAQLEELDEKIENIRNTAYEQ